MTRQVAPQWVLWTIALAGVAGAAMMGWRALAMDAEPGVRIMRCMAAAGSLMGCLGVAMALASPRLSEK